MGSLLSEAPAKTAVPRVMTVTGEVSPEALGMVLPHEHIMTDFIGADRVSKSRYDADEVFRTVLPYLTEVRELGCHTFVDCTPEYIGRDVKLLQRLSEETGLRILTPTGFYGAANDIYLPPLARTGTAKQLAEHWISEWEHGIEGTGIRPGFIKIGLDPKPSELDMKLVHAAGLTHLKTGLTISSHTGPGDSAKAQIELLKGLGVHPSAFIWVHAQAEPDAEKHLWAAKQGAWVEFDGISPESVDQHVKCVLEMEKAGYLHRVLVSHDAGWYNVGQPGGGTFRRFDTLFTKLLPALEQTGFSEVKIGQITRANPQRAFTHHIRRT